MPRRSPFTSVTPALSIATSVPVPMAIPTCACASAGASLIPSPAMATKRPSPCKPLHDAGLVLRQNFGDHFVNLKFSGDGLGGRAAVAGQHHDADAVRVQLANRFGGGLLDGIGDGEQSRDFVLDDHEHDGLAVRAQGLRSRGKRLPDRRASSSRSFRISQCDGANPPRGRERRGPSAIRTLRPCRA